MARAAKTVQIGNTVVSIQYSSNALRLLERQTGKTVQQIGLYLVSGRGGFGLLQEILWAGLEGARLKHNTRPAPFTVDEVGDLIDDHEGGAAAVWAENGLIATAVLDAWLEAFPSKKREGGEKKDENPPPAATA